MQVCVYWRRWIKARMRSVASTHSAKGADQRQTHSARTRIGAVDLTGQIRARHHCHMLFLEQIPAEPVITGNVRPQVKTAIRALHVHDRAEDFQHRIIFFAVQITAGAHVYFVIPRGNAGQLGLNRHRAAVVSAVEQEAPENVGVTGHKSRTQARQVGAFGQAVEHDAALEVLRPSSTQALSRPGGGVCSSK